MKKILIISWFAPPCGFTAAQRAQAMAEFSEENGYYPIVISRNWDIPTKKITDMDIPSGEEVKVIVHDKAEYHYVPFKGNYVSNRLNKGLFKYKAFKIPLILLELFTEYTFRKSSKYYDLIKYCIEYTRNNKVDCIFISGAPFMLFYIGYYCNRHFNLKWIADYRDPWSTDEVNYYKSELLNRLLKKIHAYYEKKWLSNTMFITSVTEYIQQRISAFVGKRGFTIYNGYFESEIQSVKLDSISENRNLFTLTYSGTMYPLMQDIHILSSGFYQFVQEAKVKYPEVEVRFNFIGTAWDPRVEQYLKKGFEKSICNIQFIDRVERLKALKIQHESDLLVMIAHQGKRGVVSSKIFEYMALNKPILLAPSDGDSQEYFSRKAQAAFVAQTDKDVSTILMNLLSRKLNGQPLVINNDYHQNYTRQNQVKAFFNQLKEFIEE